MEFSSPKTKLLGFLAGQLLALAFLLFTTLHSSEGWVDYAVGWLGVIFCSLLVLYTFSLWNKPPPHLIVDEQGIEDRRALITIEWANILDITASKRYLFIEVADPIAVEAPLPRWRRFLLRLGRGFNRAIGSSTYMINCLGLNATGEEIYTYIEQTYEWSGKAKNAV